MPKLPVKYFKTVTEYVKYNWSGAIDKLYNAVKTVTKDFTRTDPVYVRIGEDGEPEIHLTLTSDVGNSYFRNIDLENSTIYITNGTKITNCSNLFVNFNAKRIFLDAIGSTNMESMFNRSGLSSDNLVEIGLFDTSSVTNFATAFWGCSSLTTIPAFDFGSASNFTETFGYNLSLTEFHAYGVTVSFKLSTTALKHDAILEVFNNLGTVTAGSGVTLTLGDAKKALMTTEEIKIATDKGWEVA